jgi:hypothetical protein
MWSPCVAFRCWSWKYRLSPAKSTPEGANASVRVLEQLAPCCYPVSGDVKPVTYSPRQSGITALPPLSPAEHLEEYMKELLSQSSEQTSQPYVPLQGQECFSLRLDNLGTPFQSQFINSIAAGHRFLVSETHASWSKNDSDFVWDGFEQDECSTLEEARQRYASRRASIVVKGFIYSDMDCMKMGVRLVQIRTPSIISKIKKPVGDKTSPPNDILSSRAIA